ncbi:MAG TPA: hypothetical protein VFM88_02680 [Vicinamibacteria bacterium]|nr:hypothetical protein [Vicinamibacteria bacterium]
MTPADRYNRLVLADQAAAREQAEWLRSAFARRRVTFGDEPMRSFLRPHFVERAAWNRLRDDGRRLLELASRVARAAFDGDAARLCAWLGVPEALARWVALDPGEPDVVLSRLDAFLTPEGPRFIEVNSDAPAGFGYGDRMAEVFGELPLFREFARGVQVDYLASSPRVVESVLSAWRRDGRRRGGGPPAVAIVDYADVRTRADQEILLEAFEAAGVPCLLADPRELELGGGRLTARGRGIDVVYRRAVLSELVEREDEVRDFLEAYRQGAALFVNSLRCHLAEDKGFFALLLDPDFAFLMSEDEARFAARVVPWTAKVAERRLRREGLEIDLLPWILENRERLVLKPAHGYGGRSVFVGDETTPTAWESAVCEGVGGPWIVQERVAIPEEPFPIVEARGVTLESLKVNANPFYVAGFDVGAVTRASRSAVINVSAGGGSVPTFVVG